MPLTIAPPPHEPLDVDAGVIEEARRRQRRQRVVASAAAMAVAAVLLLVAFGVGGGVPGRLRSQPTGGSVGLVPGRGIASVRLSSGAGDLAAGYGAVWVSGFHAVTRLDAATGAVAATIRTSGVGDAGYIAVGDGSVWATSGLALGARGIVYRIDPQTNRVIAAIRIGHGPVFGIAVGAGRVWASIPTPAGGAGAVMQIDPSTNRVTGPPIKVGPGAIEVSYGDHAVWVAPSAVRIDPATRRVSSAPVVEALGEPAQGELIPGYGSLWEAANDFLTRFNASTGVVLMQAHMLRAQAAAIGAGAVWVLAAPRLSSPDPTLAHEIKRTAALWELNPNDNRIVGGPLWLNVVFPVAITVTAHDVWIAGGYATGIVTRIPLIRCPTARCT